MYRTWLHERVEAAGDPQPRRARQTRCTALLYPPTRCYTIHEMLPDMLHEMLTTSVHFTSPLQRVTAFQDAAGELQRPRPRLRASAASMPRLSFRGTCVAAEVVASSKPGDGVPSEAGAATIKPVKASPPSRWQRLPPPEHQQTLVREAGPMIP